MADSRFLQALKRLLSAETYVRSRAKTKVREPKARASADESRDITS